MEDKMSKMIKKKKKRIREENLIFSNFIEFHGLNFVTVIRHGLINLRDCQV